MPPLTTVLDTIEKGTLYLENKGIDDARKNMQLLVTHQLGCSRVELYMQFDRPMTEDELVPLREKLQRRGKGEPLQHLLGSVEFYKREFKSDARALVPRPETEELADILLKHSALQPKLTAVADPAEEAQETAIIPSATGANDATNSTPAPSADTANSNRLRILDMGTGSGVLGITLAAELGGRCEKIVLADISNEALSLAKENADLLGIKHHQTQRSDLFAELVGEKFHLIVANLPYIAESDRNTLAPEVLRDPDSALFGGKDGLDIIRDFIQQAPSHLHPGGLIALEIGYDQSDEVETLLRNNGFDSVKTHLDLCQIPRFPIAQLAH